MQKVLNLVLFGSTLVSFLRIALDFQWYPLWLRFEIAKIGFWKSPKNVQVSLLLGGGREVRKDTKMSLFFMSLLRGGGRGSKQIRTMSLSVHFFLLKASLNLWCIGFLKLHPISEENRNFIFQIISLRILSRRINV